MLVAFRSIAVVCVMLVSLLASAQVDFPGYEGLEPETREARQRQVRSAESAGLALVIRDEGLLSTTTLSEVPPELQGRGFPDQNALARRLPRLREYFGFTGSESFQFEHRYTDEAEPSRQVYVFRQLIRQIMTPFTLRITVGERGRVSGLDATLAVDRGFDSTPFHSETEAIRAVLAHVGNINAQTSPPPLDIMHNGLFTAVSYETGPPELGLLPVWNVYVPYHEPASDGTRLYEHFYVGLDGRVVDSGTERQVTD